MLRIDHDIEEVERRIVRRRHALEHTARLAKQRAMRGLLSPAGLLGAVGVGFIATVGLFRRKKVYVPASRAKAGKLAGLASLLASAGFALLRAQFGSPLQMAQLVLSKMKAAQQRPPSHRPVQLH